MANYNKFEPELKEKILRLHLEEGRTKKSLSEEYNVGISTLTYWLKQRREECRTNPTVKQENDAYEETRRLRRELEELKKENAFLKKAAAFFAKEIE